MVTSRLWENFSGTWEDFGAAGAEWQAGIRVWVNKAVQVDEVSWYRVHTGSAAPTSLQLWRQGDSAPLWAADAVPDNGSVGWQRATLTVPVLLMPATSYAVIWHQPIGCHYAKVPNASRGTAGTGFSWGAPSRYYLQTTGFEFPSSTTNDVEPGLDLRIMDTAGAPASAFPPVVADIQQAVTDLEAYIDNTEALLLSMVSNEATPSQYSIPNQNKTAIAAAQVDIDDILTSVGTDLHDVLVAWRDGLGAMAGYGWKEFVDAHQQTLLNVGEYLANIADFTGWRWIDQVSRFYTWLGSLGRAVPAVGGSWSKVAETSFTGDLAWNQPADLYFLHWTTLPVGLSTDDVDGVDLSRRLAWWAEWDGTVAGQRGYLDWTDSFIGGTGRRLAGIVLRPHGPCAGTIEAWQFS